MTASELLTLLGRAWPRLLIYPGGLAAFALVWMLDRVARSSDREQAPATVSVDLRLAISVVVLPWLGLALLPLPLAAGINRQIDLFAVFALLEWPLVLAVMFELRARNPDVGRGDEAAAWRLAAALNGYPPLILATLALAQSSGSFEIEALMRAPGESTPVIAGYLHWLGALAWTLALPPVLGIGPFQATFSVSPKPARCGHERSCSRKLSRPAPGRFSSPLVVGLRLRAIGLVGLTALLWGSGLEAAVGAIIRRSGAPSWAGDLVEVAPPFVWTAPAALLLVGLLWGYSRLATGPPRSWARAYLALDAALLVALLWAAYTALQERIR